MSMVETFKVTLHLRWGIDSARVISVPVEYRKGSYRGRYELYVDNVHIGWVVKHQGLWWSYLTDEQNGGYGQRESCGRTRCEAVDQIVHRLTDHARTNVLADRSAEAYRVRS